MEDTTIVNEEPVIEAPTAEETVVEPAPLPGEKTESVKLLESLQKEREKRRELETELENLRNQPTADAYSSDEARLLKAEIDRIARELESNKQNDQLKSLQTSYPALKDKGSEFQEYLENNKGMRLEVAAKAFLVENNLFENPTPRKGLERETGGTRVQPKQGRTEEEVAELRKTNYRKYEQELRKGTLWG